MSFRERILEQLEIRSAARRTAIDPNRLQAFSRKDIETCVQLYMHLKNLGHTMDDLIRHIQFLRVQENADEYHALEAAFKLDRAGRKALKKSGRSRKRR